MKNKTQNISNKAQQGATLITSMMMLVVMTILGVAATKVASLDALVVGNDQQKMMLFIKKESELKKLSTSIQLLPAMMEEGLNFSLYTVPDTPDLVVEKIKDMNSKYDCRGTGGRATSIGGFGTPVCRLYEFQLSAKSNHSSAFEIGRRGTGKQVPNDDNGF